MTNAPARFTQVDVKRLLKAGRAVDPELTVRVLPDGSLMLVKGLDATPDKPIDARPSYDFR